MNRPLIGQRAIKMLYPVLILKCPEIIFELISKKILLRYLKISQNNVNLKQNLIIYNKTTNFQNVPFESFLSKPQSKSQKTPF